MFAIRRGNPIIFYQMFLYRYNHWQWNFRFTCRSIRDDEVSRNFSDSMGPIRSSINFRGPLLRGARDFNYTVGCRLCLCLRCIWTPCCVFDFVDGPSHHQTDHTNNNSPDICPVRCKTIFPRLWATRICSSFTGSSLFM